MPITLPSGSLPREVRGSDTAQYVPVTLDIVLAFLFRVFAAAQKLPTSVALDWVASKDEQERGIWVKQFQNSTLTLGDKHKLLGPPSPGSTMCGIKLEPLHGKPNDFAKTRPAGRNKKKQCNDLMRSTEVRLGLRPPRTSPGPWYLPDLVWSFLGTRVSTEEYRAMAASAHYMRSVRACDAHVCIGRETPRMGLRRSVWANSHKFEGDVD